MDTVNYIQVVAKTKLPKLGFERSTYFCHSVLGLYKSFIYRKIRTLIKLMKASCVTMQIPVEWEFGIQAQAQQEENHHKAVNGCLWFD